MLPRVTWLWLGLALGAACGGKTVVDGKHGTGGSGGAPSSSASAMGGTSSTVTPDGAVVGTSVSQGSAPQNATVGPATVATTSTGPMMDACMSVCSAFGCGTVPNCLQDCEMPFPQQCKPQHDAWLQCLLDKAFVASKGCSYVAGCEAQVKLYATCRFGCGVGPCSVGSNGSCGCQVTCGHPTGARTYETTCQPNGDGSFSCGCLVNGKGVGKCTSPSKTTACDVYTSCCTPYFLVAD